MARIWRNCLMVRGRVSSRTMTVNTMMAMPMLLKQMVYRTTNRFNMGRMIISRQRSPISSKGPASLPGPVSRPAVQPRGLPADSFSVASVVIVFRVPAPPLFQRAAGRGIHPSHAPILRAYENGFAEGMERGGYLRAAQG